MNIKIIFFGTSEFALRPLEELSKNLEVAAVITRPDEPAGRKKILTPPPVKVLAQKLRIPVYQPEKLEIGNWKLEIPYADLYVVAAYGKMIPKEVYDLPKFKTINIHPSLLPCWRGPSPIQYVILNGDEITGVSIMLLDEKMDHGAILANSKFPSFAPQSAASASMQIPISKMAAPALSQQLSEIGAKLAIETVPKWINKEIKPMPQDESKATHSKLLKKEDGRIDWNKSATKIERQIRAFTPWPGSYTFCNRGEKKVRLEIIESSVSDSFPHGKIAVGTVRIENKKIFVATGDGAIEIIKIQPEGKKVMRALDFLNGYADINGAILY